MLLLAKMLNMKLGGLQKILTMELRLNSLPTLKWLHQQMLWNGMVKLKLLPEDLKWDQLDHISILVSQLTINKSTRLQLTRIWFTRRILILVLQQSLMLTVKASNLLKVLSHGKIKSGVKCGWDQTARHTTLDSDGKEKLMDLKQLLRSNMMLKKLTLDSSDNQCGWKLVLRWSPITGAMLPHHSSLEKTMLSVLNGIFQLHLTLRSLILIRWIWLKHSPTQQTPAILPDSALNLKFEKTICLLHKKTNFYKYIFKLK